MSLPPTFVFDVGGALIQQNDFSPWGEKIHTNVLISGNFPYLYGGKENLELFDIPYYDSIARLQTTDGVFLNADPLAEASYATGPYAYCAGNPLSMTDPLGLTRYMVDGVPHDIDDGYNETIEVSANELEAMQQLYGSFLYYSLRNHCMNKYGYTTGDGQLVLASSVLEEPAIVIEQGTLLISEDKEYQWDPWGAVSYFAGVSNIYSKIFYNEKNGFWIDKNFEVRSFKVTGNQYLGGRNQWAKKMSIRLKGIGKRLGYVGVGMDLLQLYRDYKTHASSQTIIIHSVDLAIDGIGYIPIIGPGVSLSYPFLRDKMIDYVILPAYEYLTEQ